jgi:Transcriptional regulator, AbiEi antitoxin
MTTRIEALRAVGDLAMDQWGLITTAQAHNAGLSSQQLARFADTGVLERLRHGVYRVVGAPPNLNDDLRAAWLALAPARTAQERLADPDVEVVSHRSAAVVHQLGDLDADRLEFTTRTRKQTRDSQVRFHRRQLGVGEWTLVDGLPVTTVLATIGDLAAARLDGGHLAGVVRDAVTTHHVDLDEVIAVLSPHAHHYGVPLGQGGTLLTRMLEQAGVPESTLAVGRLVVPYLDPESMRKAVVQAVAQVGAMDPESMRKAVVQAVAQVGAMDQESMRKAVVQAVAQVGAMDQESMRKAVVQAVAQVGAMDQESMRKALADARDVDTAVVQVTAAATGQPTPSARKQLGAGEDE